MTKQYNSIILQIAKKQNHRDNIIKFLSTVDSTKNIKANNPNLNIFEPEENKKISIELVRKMINESSLGIYSGDVRVLVLTHADTASISAQNALLKLIEEPPSGTQIILTAENPTQLLPTILSRCLLIKIPLLRGQAEGRGMLLAREGEAGEVLPTSHSEAIDLAEKYKDRDAAIELVEKLIISLQKENTQNPDKQTTKKLQILSQTLQHLRANINVRLALEHGMFEIIENANMYS